MPQNLTLAFNFTLPGGAGNATEVIGDGLIVDVLFDLDGLDLPFDQGDQVFFPCSATETSPGINMTFNLMMSLDDFILGAELCPVFNGTNNPGNCSQFMTCPCPEDPCKDQICDEPIQPGLRCQNGRSVCVAGLGFTNFSINAEGELEAELGPVGGGPQPNATTAGLDCSGPALEFCTCPVLNITTFPNGTVTSIEVLPQGLGPGDLLAGGSFNGSMWMISEIYNFTLGGNDFMCANGTAVCLCSSVLPEICFEINNCSAAYHLDGVPDSASALRIIGNTAEGLPIGLHIERISYELVTRSSFLVPRWFFDAGTLHEIVRQQNLGITGTVNDTTQGLKGWWKATTCNEGCPLGTPTELVDACGIDHRFNADTFSFGVLRYNRIVTAIELCPFNNLILHRSINVYEEEIIFNRTGLFLLSYNQAVVVRSNHTIAANNCTLRAITFIHPAENQLPLIRPNRASIAEFSFLNFGVTAELSIIAPNNFAVLNLLMLGNSVTEAGAIVGDIGTNFTFRYNRLENFLSRALDIFVPDADISFNFFDTIFGRSIRVRGAFSYFVICNLFVNCRGISEGTGIDIVALEAFNLQKQFGEVASFEDVESVAETLATEEFEDDDDDDDAAQNLDARFGIVILTVATCNSSRLCFVAGNVQSTDEGVSDLSDTFIRIAGGDITPPDVRDNAATKAQFGLYFLWIQNITFDSRFEIYHFNPLIRVADVQNSEPRGDFLFRRPGSLIDLPCGYPDCRSLVLDPIAWTINKNWMLLETPFYGINMLNNVTTADRYMSLLDFRNLSDVDFAIRVSQENGSRMSRERIILRRPAAFFGDRFPCGVKPAILGSGHQIITWYANSTDMEYRYDDFAPQIGLQLWLTPLFSGAHAIIFRGNCFVGRQQVDAGRIHIADFTMENNNGTFIFLDNLVNEWHHLGPSVKRLNRKRIVEGRPIPVLQMEDGREEALELVSVTSGIYVKWRRGLLVPRLRSSSLEELMNRIQNLSTLALVAGNALHDLDGTGLSLQNVHSARVENNSLVNVGMRRDDESSGLFLSGLLDSNGSYIFRGNFYNQTLPMLFPQVGTIKTTPGGTSGGAPTHFAAYWLHQMCNASVWLFRDNVAVVFTPQGEESNRSTSTFTTHGKLDSALVRGADYGVRFSSICNATFFLNIPPGQMVFFPEFRPEQVGLRKLVEQGNQEVDGTVCDVILCEPFSDVFWSTRSFRRDCTCCRGGCIVSPPNRCIVDRDNNTFVAGNPLLGSFFFISLNDAVVNCSAPSRVIEVRRQATPYVEQLVLEGPGFFFITGTPNFANVFEEQDTNFDIPSTLWPGQTMQLGLDNRAVFRTANVKINVPGLVFQNVRWEQNGAAATITSEVLLLSNLTFLNNSFDGMGSFQPALKGSFLNLTLVGNSWRDYRGPFVHDVVGGCTQGMLIMIVNSFRRLGGQLRYVELNSYLVRGNLFVNSGCRQPGPTSMILLRACLNASGEVLSRGPMLFEENVSQQPNPAGIIDMPDGVGYCASYYLDGVPSNQSGCFARKNAAEGLPVGMRVDHIPDENTNSSNVLGNRPQLTLQLLYALCQNVFVNGSWHDLVRGPPSDDPLIESDPIENRDKFCDDGCPYENNYWGLVLIFFPIVIILFCCFICCVGSNEPRVEYVYSAVLGREIPKDQNLWPQLVYKQNPSGYGSRPISAQEIQESSRASTERWRQERRQEVTDQQAVDRAYDGVVSPWGEDSEEEDREIK